MSTTPKAVDSVVSDPLAEALDRLERSMSGGSAAAPLEDGKGAKPMVPEGADPPVRERAEEPTAWKAPAQVPMAKPAPPAAPPKGRKASPTTRPLAPARKAAPVRTENASQPDQRAVVETWSAPVPGTQEDAPPESTQPKLAESAAVPKARAEVPTWEDVAAEPPARREDLAPQHSRPAVASEPVPEEILTEIADFPEAAPVAARRTGNRRATVGGGGVWKLVMMFVLLQIAILAAAVFVLWPKLRQEVIEDAGLAAQGGREASEALNARVAASEGRLGEIDSEMKSIGLQLSASPTDAWEELDYLGGRNRLLELGDKAIQNADRAALEQLRKAALASPDERLRDGANSEIGRVRAAYATGLRSGSYTLPVGQLFPALRQKTELQLGVDQLVKVLSDQTVRAEYRSKAAYLLADHRGGRGAEALATAIAEDPNLDVVREACLTFCEMTGYRTRDHLDSKSATLWWASNRVRVKAVLGE